MESNDEHASIDSTHGSLTDLQQSFNQQQVIFNAKFSKKKNVFVSKIVIFFIHFGSGENFRVERLGETVGRRPWQKYG